MLSMKKRKRERGFITVFVTLLMVPVVACTGMMVDVARLKLYSSQAAMAADAYGEVVLSEYDHLLKQLYGLFSVTQNEEGLRSILDFQNYMRYSFAPAEDGEKFQGFMPYQNAEVEISYENVEGASLGNNSVLMTQIGDFMKFRVVEEVLVNTDILDTLERFDAMSSDMDAVSERNKITNSSSKALEKIGEYYDTLSCIDDYPDYLEERTYYFEGYSSELTAIYESDEYKKYVYYLEHKDEIDSAKARVEEAGSDSVIEPPEGITPEEGEGNAGTLEEDKATAEGYVDTAAYQAEIETQLQPWIEGLNKTEKKIKFGAAEKNLKELEKTQKRLNETLKTLEQQVSTLKKKLQECSEDLRDEITKEIADLEEITKYAGDFKKTVDLLYENDISGKDKTNQEWWKEESKNLEDVKNQLLSGNSEIAEWKSTTQFEWYDFQDDMSSFYSMLKKLCGGGDGETSNRNAADEKIKNAEKIQKEIQSEIEDKEETDARNITANLAAELEIPGSSSEVPDLMDCFSGGASFESLGNSVLGKFLLTTYDFGMFSSRVSGIPPKNEAGAESTSTENAIESGEYYDTSLTDIKMSKDVNYLYGAELEYALGGHHKSADNLSHTRNIICGIRMTTNYVATYSIKEVNRMINTIAQTAADSVVVASGGAASAAAPLIRVAVSGALRLAVATAESAADWKLLMEREKVVFYKTKLSDMTADNAILSGLLETSVSTEKSESEELGLSYEDYLYVLMALFVDEDTLLDRTSNLITLNVNQSQNEGDVLGNLKFKMSDTVTAVKSTCTINEKFIIVPKKFVDMFISGTETETMIQKLDNGAYGYSIIRGY